MKRLPTQTRQLAFTLLDSFACPKDAVKQNIVADRGEAEVVLLRQGKLCSLGRQSFYV